jgi:radical SAM protein with 4Fe4S-binding SPASM domain
MFNVDAVPYIPFKPSANGDGWLMQNPITGAECEFNESAHRLIQMCDGYRTWGEIITELGRAYQVSSTQVKSLSESLLRELTEDGLLWWRAQRTNWWRLGPPASVLWNLTERCNLACRHCVVDAGPTRYSEEDELTLEECRDLIDQLADFGVSSLILSGGEPLMRPDLLEIAEYAGERGLHMQVATNGALVTKEVATRLAAIGKVEAQVSLDGATPQVHDDFRQVAGTWERAIQGIRNLVAAEIPVMMAAAVTKANIDQIPNLYKLAADLRVQRFRILPFVPYGRGASARKLEVSPQEMREVTEYLYRQREGGGLDVAPMEFECTLAPPPPDGRAPSEARIGCDGAVGYVTVTADGDVLPCNFFAGAEAENLREHSFTWIWENSRFLNYFRSLTVSDIHGVCQTCDWQAECRGSCVAANFAHGDIFQSNVHCWLVASSRTAEPGVEYHD